MSPLTPNTLQAEAPESAPVIVRAYDPRWAEEFAAISQTLAAPLEGLVEAIEHVGSTSVPGLAAKPIIDIDVVIAQAADFEPVRAALEKLGYFHRGDLGVTGREAFGYAGQPGAFARHLYVCQRDSAELKRHLAFRDYLRANPTARDEYAAVKAAAARCHPDNIAAYIDEKTDFIQPVLERLGMVPETIEGRIPGLLANRYGLTVLTLEPVPGGTTALDFHVHAKEGDFFLKAYDKSRDSTALFTRNIPGYIPLLAWLNRVPGLEGSLPLPVVTCSGKAFCEDNLAFYLMYIFLEGTILGKSLPTRNQVDSLAQTIARIHNVDTASLPQLPISRETFAVPFLEELRGIAQGKAPFILSADVHSAVTANAKTLLARLQEVEILQGKMATSRLPFVLCHTDLHGWNMMACGERLVVLDWEGLKLSPAEADLVFMVETPYAGEFMRVYCEIRGGCELNLQALQFFRIRRKLEDIWLFIRELSLDTLTPESREQVFNWFHSGLEMLGKEQLFLG